MQTSQWVGAVRTALVVDDEQTVLSVMRRFLERRGWSVLAADSAEGALELLADADLRFDIVLCDLNLPGLSGSDLFRRLTTMRPELARRLVLTSGDPESAKRELDVHSLTCRVLGKPFTLSDLEQTLDGISYVS
jgi:two-component system cell cycle sensor histidine kinase/response regulator CckA